MLESTHHMTLKSKRESSNFPNFLNLRNSNLKFAVCKFFLIVTSFNVTLSSDKLIKIIEVISMINLIQY